MSDLNIKFKKYIETHLGRVITQMDRDPDSPTFGCFDRNYWHYKVRDFPSSILQQGVFTLELIRKGEISFDATQETIEKWCVAAINALSNQMNKSGAVSEYYPNENSYPAAAFSLSSACKVMADWQRSAPHLLELIDWNSFEKLAEHVASRVELEAANQQAIGLAGIALAKKIGITSVTEQHIEEHADRFFKSQHSEGWFKEYGGADFGYLSVTIDALVDYYDATRDERALDAIDNAITFLAVCIGADGKLPSTLNSRNTDYVVPYGIVRTAARNKTASWIVDTLFSDMNKPIHFLGSIDDRYHAHYIYASVVRSLPHLNDMAESRPFDHKKEYWLSGCGYWIFWSDEEDWTVFVGTKKGGVIRIHRKDTKPLTDEGWRIYDGIKIWTTNWWSENVEITKNDQSIQIKERCKKVKYFVPTSFKHFNLRFLALFLREKLIPILKKLMIFSESEANGPEFKRYIEIESEKLRIEDYFSYSKSAKVKPAPRQNTRHVASADSFNVEEWTDSLLKNEEYVLDGETLIETTCPFPESDHQSVANKHA